MLGKQLLQEQNDTQYRDTQQSLLMSSMFRPIRLVKCKDHQDETYTNFCLHKQCMRALCPDCIDRHNIFHEQTNTFPKIQSLKIVKHQCKQKLTEVKNNVEQLYDQVDELVFNYNFDDQDDGIKKIISCKDNIIDQVNTYFDQLIEKYRNRASNLIEKDEKIKNVLDILSQYLEEIELMAGKMEGVTTQIDALNEVIQFKQQQIIKDNQKDDINFDLVLHQNKMIDMNKYILFHLKLKICVHYIQVLF